MTQEQFLANRKLEWLKQERRDFIDVFLEDWECDRWLAEWEAQEQGFRDQWHEQHPDGTEDDGDEWLNRQFLVWREERREALREEAQGKSREQEAEYERRWEAYVRENEGQSLRSERREARK